MEDKSHIGTDNVTFRRGFVAEVDCCGTNAFATWQRLGPGLVQVHPIERVVVSPHHVLERPDGWETDIGMLPSWFARFYLGLSSRYPYRKTRKEAEKFLSDVIIKWAKFSHKTNRVGIFPLTKI